MKVVHVLDLQLLAIGFDLFVCTCQKFVLAYNFFHLIIKMLFLLFSLYSLCLKPLLQILDLKFNFL